MRKQYTRGTQSLVVKVGTSILTRNGRFDRRVVESLARQVADFLKKGMQVSIVSSGAIGAGMSLLKMKERPKTMEGLQGAAAVGQRYLMQCYEEAFAKKGFSTAQVLLTWDDLARKTRFMNAKRTLGEIQKWGLVPIINENDTVATDEIRFGDNDRLSSLLAMLIQADLLIILSDTNGLYADGRRGDARHRISVVEKMQNSVFSHVKDSRNAVTVGGMRSKLKAIHASVGAGIPVFLADGRDKSVLLKIFEGEDVGTLFLPTERSNGNKNWMKRFMSHVNDRRN